MMTLIEWAKATLSTHRTGAGAKVRSACFAVAVAEALPGIRQALDEHDLEYDCDAEIATLDALAKMLESE